MNASPDKPARTWGYWTQAKLEILQKYLKAFTLASKGVSDKVYFDAFAGEGSGVDRLTGKAFTGSARLALNVDEPPFTKLRYFELGSNADALATQFRTDYPGRNILVYGGDCNLMIPKALSDLKAFRWAPTFAFLDPDGMELAWSTLKALADHKRGYRKSGSAKPEYKVEMWMLFPSGGLIRTLALDPEKLRNDDTQRATRLFGSEDWRSIYKSRSAGQIDGATAREAYVNLMRWCLEKDLGYAWTHPLEIKNLKGSPLYHMILATDNPTGTKIISHLYSEAAKRIPAMREEALERQKLFQQDRLFSDLVELEPYSYEPPWNPAGSSVDLPSGP